jgi:hypothetical protein
MVCENTIHQYNSRRRSKKGREELAVGKMKEVSFE